MKVKEEEGEGGVCGGVQKLEYSRVHVHVGPLVGVGGSCARLVGNSVYMC